MEKHKLTINGDQIAVKVAGEGFPIILIHGNSASSKAYQHQLEGKLAEDYRVIALDLPGHGDSSPASDMATYSMPGYANVVAEVAKALEASFGVFVGWSLGGHVLLEGVEMLNKAKGFVIFGTPPVGKPPAMEEAFLPHPTNGVLFAPELSEEQIQSFATSFFQEGVTPPPHFVEDVRNTDGNARGYMGASVGEGRFKDEIEVVASMQRPLAILHGANEVLVNGEYIKTLTMPTLWRGEIQMVEGAGHTPQWENPEAFNALIAAFVEDVHS